MSNENLVWFITGCSSGFGRNLSETALSRGDRVVVTARNPDTVVELGKRYPDQALIVSLDVTNPDQTREAVSLALASFGRIDVLVNNAGLGLQGPAENAERNQIRRLFETNLFGLMDLTRTVLPTLRAQGRGHIVNLSSVAGRIGLPMLALYGSSKFAVEGFSEGLAGEVAKFGIRVTIIEPGPFTTDFVSRSMETIPPSEPYRELAQSIDKALAAMPFGAPSEVVDAIIKVVDMQDPPRRLAVGAYAEQALRASLLAQLAELDRGMA
ncbi:SDR family oxidoreductase [Magnetospirillum sp. 15-1]|uniref:SDR family oxidoreductase n=1 Tax=Magnetospirillum sp. 15-1 TaxID=1979370 RepID=UPI000BBBF423|nr:SDR family oxidoreductase [Magnetospirillum sp. 15-1]